MTMLPTVAATGPATPRGLLRIGVIGLRLALALAVGIAASLAPLPATARNRLNPTALNPDAQRITMGVGKSTIIDLDQDAAEIFVANPAVANAIVRTARKIYIIGAGPGQTTLFALDKQGREIASYEISIGRDVGELTQILRVALPGSRIVVRTVGDSLILTGEVNSAEEAQRAADMAEGFVKQVNATGGAPGAGGANAGMVVNSLTIRGRDQVMLKVTISEMRRDIAKQLGISSSSWGALTQYNPFSINGPLSAGSAVFGDGTAAPTSTQLNINSGNGLKATLQAFERYGVNRTLAEPTVTAISGESAKFFVGGEFPYSTGLICGAVGAATVAGGTSSTSQCSSGAAFKPYGISLRFEPVVLSEGRILLHVGTEVSDLDFTHGAIVGGVSTPGLLSRNNETTIELPSGGSIATAGLIQQKSLQVINGLPGLLNIPILGTLFRSRDYQKSETELMIIVTPIIVKPVAASALAKPDDGFTDASDPQAYLLGRMNKLYATPGNPQARRDYHGRVGFIQD